MIGRKLDARSYTTFLLAVVSILLTLALLAQTDTPTFSDAAAINGVARSTSDVASANRQIAASIDNLATAVGRLKLEVPGAAAGAAGGVAPVAAAGGAVDSYDAEAAAVEEAPAAYEGSFTIR